MIATYIAVNAHIKNKATGHMTNVTYDWWQASDVSCHLDRYSMSGP